MRIAAIDVGTNSTRLLVAEVRTGGFRTLEKRTIVTRLGQNVDKTRSLRQDALNRTLAVVADYAAVCGEYGVEQMIVSGTSAVRDATNRNEFFTGIQSLTGVVPVMLTGEEEARTMFAGAVSDLEPSSPTLVIDIGGGSTELVYGRTEPEYLMSRDIGVVRLLEKYLHSDPPGPSELEALREEAVAELAPFRVDAGVSADTRLVGVAGTVTQLAAIKAGLAVYDPDVVHHMVLTHGDVRMLARRLSSLPLDGRRRVKGIDPNRADVIVSGAEILKCAMEVFDLGEVTVSEKDILDGLILRLLSSTNV
jgi:exopolyphosphatase / guanosine-5'-triphosphate,3'-diphosphate pyrophosphatase